MNLFIVAAAECSGSIKPKLWFCWVNKLTLSVCVWSRRTWSWCSERVSRESGTSHAYSMTLDPTDTNTPQPDLFVFPQSLQSGPGSSGRPVAPAHLSGESHGLILKVQGRASCLNVWFFMRLVDLSLDHSKSRLDLNHSKSRSVNSVWTQIKHYWY